MKQNLNLTLKPLTGILSLLTLTGLSVQPAQAQFDFGDSAPEKPGWQLFSLDPKAKVTLDFRNASVDAIIRMLSQASGVTILKDPSLTGGLTLQSPRQQSLDSAFALFNAVLGLKNFELQKQNNFLIIKPKQAGRGFGGRGGATGIDPSAFTAMAGSSTQLKVYPIKYANAAQVARVINDVFATPTTPPDLSGLAALAGGAGGNAGGAAGGGGGNPFAFGRRQGGAGGGGGGRFGAGGFGGFGGFGGGRNATTSAVKASADDYSNSVIVNASSRDQSQVATLIGQIDKQTDQPQQSKVFPLKYAAASELVSVVQNVLTSNAPRGRGGQGTQNIPIDQRFQQAFRVGGQAAFGQVVADVRTNSLIVTATQDNLSIVSQTIAELDKEVPFVSSAFVITLANARADQVAQVINQSFGSRNGTNVGNTGGRTTGTTGGNRANANNRNSQPTTLGGGRAANLPGSGGATSRAVNPDPNTELALDLANPEAGAGELATNVSVQQGGFGFGGFGQGGFGGFRQQQNSGRQVSTDQQGRVINVRDLTGDVTVIPDINTNSVIVVTSPQNRDIVEQILSQLDKIPEQVMIETLIVEASLDATNKLGVEWNLNQTNVFNDKNTTAKTTQAFGLAADASQPQGLRYTLTGTQYGAFLQALQKDTRFEVLSTPRIFTSNNSTAQINISQSLPYVLSQQTLANGNIAFNYAFLDVGIVLTVTPRITSNGYVTMDVTQTANDFVNYTSFNAPVVNQREADTTVSVKDGETIVLGGIIKNTVSTTVNKIPLLGDIPLLGNLFKSNTTDKNKTELLVFLTPHVVRDDAEAQKLRADTEKQLQPNTLERLKEVRKRGTPMKEGESVPSLSPKTGTEKPGTPPVAPPKPADGAATENKTPGTPNP